MKPETRLSGVIVALALAATAVVAVFKDDRFSKQSAEHLATHRGEVSGVKNLQATKTSSSKVKLTWQATSAAVEEWRIYRNGRLWRTVPSNKRNPGGTNTYIDHWSTPKDASYYTVRAVGPNNHEGDAGVALSPLATEAAKTMERKETKKKGDACLGPSYCRFGTRHLRNPGYDGPGSTTAATTPHTCFDEGTC